MKRWMVITVAIALLVGTSVFFLRGLGTRRAERPVLPAATVGGDVIAEARVVPTRYVSLSLATGGALAEVFVAEGARVRSGQLLARLDTARQASAAVNQAEAALHGAEAKLAELRSGARAQEIDAARGTRDAARARYRQLLAGARPEEREQARMGVEQAEAQVRAVQETVRQADVDLQLAQADLRRMEHLLSLIHI